MGQLELSAFTASQHRVKCVLSSDSEPGGRSAVTGPKTSMAHHRAQEITGQLSVQLPTAAF